MAKGKKRAKKPDPTPQFLIGQIVTLVTGGLRMVVTDTWSNGVDAFMVRVAFFGRSETTHRGSRFEVSLIERVYDERVLMHDSDIPF